MPCYSKIRTADIPEDRSTSSAGADAIRRGLLRACSVAGAYAIAGCGGGTEHAAQAGTLDPASREGASDASVLPPLDTSPPPSLPYKLATSGTAVAISTNTAASAGSKELSANEWNETLFNSFGAGTFVPDWSAGGAYVLAGTGGHGHGCNPGAMLFDFTDGRWKQARAANPAQAIRLKDYDESETTGAPFFEIRDSEQTPAPTHPYGHLCAVPRDWVANHKGGVIYISRAAVCSQARASGACHWFDFDTQRWARRTDSVFPTFGSGYADVEGDALIDTKRKRYYLLSGTEAHYAKALKWLEVSDWTIRTSASFGSPPTAVASGRMFLHAGDFIIRQCGNGQSLLYALDLNDIENGWRRLKLAGLPLPTSPGGSSGNRWAHWRGKYYHLSRDGGKALLRLSPPPDVLTGTWAVESVPIDISLPSRGGTQAHYTSLFEVPAIDCLGWVPGWDKAVYIIRPE